MCIRLWYSGHFGSLFLNLRRCVSRPLHFGVVSFYADIFGCLDLTNVPITHSAPATSLLCLRLRHKKVALIMI